MKWGDIAEVLKNLSGAVSSLAVLAENKYSILHLNPKISEDVGVVSAILAAVAGFGAHQLTKRSGRIVFGWIGLGLCVVTLLVILWLASNPSSLSPETVSYAARATYVLFFTFVGGAIGGFFE